MDFFYEWLDKLRVLIENNFWLAPLIGILLPFLEAIFPMLPLAIIISFNLSVLGITFGAIEGTVLTITLSTIGSFLGMFLLYIIIRLTVADYFVKKIKKYEYGETFIKAVHGKSNIFILALLSNPFLPSSILNYGLSLSKIQIKKYLFLTIISRLFIVLFMVFLGSVFSLQENPLNVLWMMIVYFVILGLWIIYLRSRKEKKGSFFEKKIDR
ncbi:VTT domain-containing protein [Mycoplasmatota bacterium]|nr:VTT domain-containing protein [Mycoplasmatota bacterium]